MSCVSPPHLFLDKTSHQIWSWVFELDQQPTSPGVHLFPQPQPGFIGAGKYFIHRTISLVHSPTTPALIFFFLVFIQFLIVCMCLSVYVFVQMPWRSEAPDPLELELQMLVSHLIWVLKIILWENIHCMLLIAEPYLQPGFYIFIDGNFCICKIYKSEQEI